jgi:hypothetical protein
MERIRKAAVQAVPVNAMKAYGEVEVHLQAFGPSALYEGECLASRSVRFTPGEGACERHRGGSDTLGNGNIFVPTGNRSAISR